MLIIPDDQETQSVELAKKNRHKNGAPFKYTETMFAAIAIIKSMAHLPSRQLAGMVEEMLPQSQTPNYPTIYRRLCNLSTNTIGNMITVTSNGGGHRLLLAVDATGLKVGNRGEWIRHKWKVRRGYVKLHALVDTDTGMILAFSTDESEEIQRCLYRC